MAYALTAAVIGAGYLNPLPMASGQSTEPAEPADPPKAAPAAAATTQAGGVMDRAADSASQVYVDDSFASLEKLRTANRYAAQGQSQLAIQAYQGIIDEFGQKLVYLNNDAYSSITDYVRGKLLQMPAVQSGAYDQLFGVQAQKAIDTAMGGGSGGAHHFSELMRACDRYFPSTAAFNGLSTAAAWQFEEGDFAAAGRIWKKLLTHPHAMHNSAELLFRAAVAESLSGDEKSAKALQAQLAAQYPDATGSVNGQTTPLLAKLNEVMAIPAWHAPEAAKDEWPGFQGGPTREGLLKVDASIGAQLWTMGLNGGPDADLMAMRVNTRMLIQRRMQFNGGGVGGGAPDPFLTSYPVLSGGVLFIHGTDHILALSENSGTFLWTYPGGPQGEDTRGQPVRVGARFVMQTPTAAHDSVSICGDRAYAMLPVRPHVSGAEEQAQGNFPGMMGMTGTEVVCLDRTDGHPRWSTPAKNVTVDGKNDLIFVGSPVATKQGVYIMAKKAGQASFVQSYIVRLNSDTGAVEWSCYLCSASSGMMYGAAAFGSVPIPSLVQEVLYISTGQGATCAVDANLGRILWLQIASSSKKSRNPADFYTQQQTTVSWKFNPPLVYGDKLITLESSSDEEVLGVYDRWTGRPIRSISPKEMGMATADVLDGIVGSTLIVSGSQVVGLNLDKIGEVTEPVWRCSFPLSEQTGREQGRPFLSQNGLYVPFEKGMALVEVLSGKLADFWQWPRTEKDPGEGEGGATGKPGNLLVTSEQVVVVTDSEVAGYSRWETARDNRLAQIRLHPNDPQAYLALAEVAYRTNHLDLADENMKQAVAIATGAAEGGGGGGGGASGAGDLIARLYRTNLSFAEQLADKTDDSLLSRARFYYEQCKLTARTADQQAEWRLSMADFALAEHKPEEAATLYNAVLTDSALRGATYRHKETVARAGVTAELKFRALIQQGGPGVYARFEDQAKALLASAQAQHDPAILQQTVDSYPNSTAAIAAAGQLAVIYRDKQDWAGEIKALRWLYPRTDGDAKGHVVADLATAQFSMKRYSGALAWAERGVRQYKDLTWTVPGTAQTENFVILRDRLKNSGLAVAEGRRPELPPPQQDASGRPLLGPAMDESSATDIFAAGSLLVPVEQSLAFRRPDLLFVSSNRALHVYPVGKSEGTPPWSVELPGVVNGGTCMLLGSLGDITVAADAGAVFGVNTRTHALAWQMLLSHGSNERGTARGASRLNIVNGVVIQGRGRLLVNGQFINGIRPEDGSIDPADPEVLRQLAVARLGVSDLSTMRMVNDKLVIVSNGAMSAFDIATGKSAWTDATGAPLSVKLPANTSAVVAGNEDLIVAEVTAADRDATSYVVVDAETGKFRKQINLENEHAQWRTVGDDGTLFVVSDQAVAAYDLFADQEQPVWRRSDLQSRFPSATQLTLDGLMLVNTNSELMCLSQESGEVRWPSPSSGPIRLNIPEPSSLRSVIDGDNVIYESAQGILAYMSAPQDSADDQVAWIGSITQGQMPPLDSFQVSDPYVVALAVGPTNGGVQRSVRLIFLNRKGGRIHFIKTIQRSANAADPEGPSITAWQVVDGGIAMEVGGSVHFYHGKLPG
jgi:outer membrane protein assembly factor BamB